MGCGGSTAASNNQYINGYPLFESDEVVKGFDQENGLLFRLVNRNTGTWAFYNDTKEYEMRIRTIFNYRSQIRALGHTKLERMKNGDWMASVSVPPLGTELFIEGKVNGFKSKMDAVPLYEYES